MGDVDFIIDFKYIMFFYKYLLSNKETQKLDKYYSLLTFYCFYDYSIFVSFYRNCNYY